MNLEGLDGLEEIVEIDIDSKGKVIPATHDKTIIIDADTLVFGTCTMFEYEMFDEWDLPLDQAYANVLDKLDYILEQVGGKRENTELHFTGSPFSFRYTLLLEAFPDDETMWYKHKRKKNRKPAGLTELKEMVVEHNPVRECQIHQKWEADDYTVLRKKELGDDCIMCAVDKDLLYNTPGKHFNYYSSVKHQIEMCWVEIDEHDAYYHTHLQTIMGDKSDNVPGLKGIGPAKAAKFIDKDMTVNEMWEGVIAAYNRHCDYGNPVDMAILNRRLICMNQLKRKENGECQITLWEPTKVQ